MFSIGCKASSPNGAKNLTAFVVGLAFLAMSFVLALAGGGLGLILLNPLWVWYWRQREYAADAYAARCGQAAPLAEYLEDHQGFDVAVPYFLAEHPYTELRIDRLLLAIEQEHMPPGGFSFLTRL